MKTGYRFHRVASFIFAAVFAAAFARADGLPAGYKLTAWTQGEWTGQNAGLGPYSLLNLIYNTTNAVEMRVMFTKTSAEFSNNSMILCGTRINNTKMLGFGWGGSTSQWQWTMGDNVTVKSSEAAIAKNVPYHVLLADRHMTLDGVVVSDMDQSAVPAFTAGKRLYFMSQAPANATEGGGINGASAKAYSFRVWTDSSRTQLRLNLVPCVNPSGTAGFYDTVADAFYGSSDNKKTYTAGPSGEGIRLGPDGEVECRFSLTNDTDEAVLSLDGGTTWFAGTNTWLKPATPVSIVRKPAPGQLVVWRGLPADAVVSADRLGVTLWGGVQSLSVKVDAFAPTHVWTGEVDTDFATAGNWTDVEGNAVAEAPGEESDVYVPVGCVNQPVAASAISVRSFRIGALTNTAESATFTSQTDATHQIAGALVLYSGGVMTHTALPGSAKKVADECYKLNLVCGGSFTVDQGAAVDVTGKGYSPANKAGQGPGRVTDADQSDKNNSASHGGSLYQGFSYGSLSCPTNCGTASVSTSGGGAVKITAGGVCTVNGSILSEGVTYNSYRSGAGGSVWITAPELAGAGTVSVCGGWAQWGFSGSGGRLAVHLTEAKDFSAWKGRLKASGGFSNDYNNRPAGAPGTIYLEPAGGGWTNSTVIVSEEDVCTYAKGTTGFVELTAKTGADRIGTLVITNAGRVRIAAGDTVSIYKDWRSDQGFGTILGTVAFAGPNEALVTGKVPFDDVTCTEPGKTIRFGTGADDNFTFKTGSFITLQGGEENPLSLLPAVADAPWKFTLTTDCAMDILHVAASNSNASAGLSVLAIESQDLGGNHNWGFSEKILPGEPIQWTGAGGNSLWTDSANWEDKNGEHRPPVETDLVIIPKEGASPEHWPVLANGTTILNRIRIGATGSLTLQNVTLYATNELSVAGALVARGGEYVICPNEVRFTGAGSFTPAQSVFRLEGDFAQAVDLNGQPFCRLEVRKAGGSVAFGDGFSAATFDAITENEVTFSFGAGTRVTATEFFCRGHQGSAPGADALSLVSSVAEQPWELALGENHYISGVKVSDSRATAVKARADTLSTDAGRNVNWDFGVNSSEWTGAVNTSFNTAGNWYPAGVPGADRNVLIAPRKGDSWTVTLSGATAVSNLTVGTAGTDAGAVTFKSPAPLTVYGDLVVGTNATVVLSSLDEPNVVTGNVLVHAGGTLTHDALNASANTIGQQDKRLDLEVGGDMTIERGGSVNVTGKGYAPCKGPGSFFSGSGYHYAGHGGLSCVATLGSAYGSAFEPMTCGSGGHFTGALGGGAVRLTVAGTLALDGSILADGMGGSNGAMPAGGSVNVRCGTLTGAGKISASSPDGRYYGGGGGGHVAVRASTSLSGFSGEIGSFGSFIWGHLYGYGGAGTVYVQGPDEEEGCGTMIIDNSRLRNGAGFKVTQSRLWTELPLGEPKSLKGALLVLEDLSELRLTEDMIVRDIDIRNATAKICLCGHVLTVRSSAHKNGRGWADTYANLVDEGDGGRIIWKSAGTLMIVK